MRSLTGLPSRFPNYTLENMRRDPTDPARVAVRTRHEKIRFGAVFKNKLRGLSDYRTEKIAAMCGWNEPAYPLTAVAKVQEQRDAIVEACFGSTSLRERIEALLKRTRRAP